MMASLFNKLLKPISAYVDMEEEDRAFMQQIGKQLLAATPEGARGAGVMTGPSTGI